MFAVIQGDKLVGRMEFYFCIYVARPDFGRDLRNAETDMDDSFSGSEPGPAVLEI